MGILSTREYKCVAVYGKGEEESIQFHLTKLLEPQETEFMFSLQEQADEILDLQIGQSTFVSTNRNDADCKGVLIRIK